MFYMSWSQTTSTFFPYTTLFRSGRRDGIRNPSCQAVRPTVRRTGAPQRHPRGGPVPGRRVAGDAGRRHGAAEDRKSTRLNSSHMSISYAVFCLKKKKSVKVVDPT